MKKLLPIPLIALAGCQSPIFTNNVPEGVSMLRCTEFLGDVDGVSTNIHGEGFQCTQAGDSLKGKITVEGDSFKVTIDPDES